jgi:hypothetical protein
MTEPVDVYDPRDHDHRRDQSNGQNHGRTPQDGDNYGNGHADRGCRNAGRGAPSSDPCGSPASGRQWNHSQIRPTAGCDPPIGKLPIPPVPKDKRVESGTRSVNMPP